MDRHLWLCIILTLSVVLPRSLLVSHAHTQCVDDEYHLDHGLTILRGEHQPITYNDPPLGEMVLAFPLWLAGCEPLEIKVLQKGVAVPHRTVLHGQLFSVDALLLMVAAWKALLFVPAVAVAFTWVRSIYGLRSAWLAVALLVVDPNIAGHLPIAALDALAMQAVLIASFLAWRYIQQPTRLRLFVAGVATAAAMLTKHTAVVLPLAVVSLAALEWLVRPWVRGRSWRDLRREIRPSLNALAAGAIVVLVAIWAFTLFDYSPPRQWGSLAPIEYSEKFDLWDDILAPAMKSNWPAGIYLGSLLEAKQHAAQGHYGYLWGETRFHGWWYYYLAVALYKVPVGIWLVLLAAAVSVVRVRPRWEELSILVPLLACAGLIMLSGINIGFRHALPSYALLLLLASRCVATGGRGWLAWAWGGVVMAAIHVTSAHPDYISYTNGIFRRPYLAITDSNIDWGQSHKQVARWLKANRRAGQSVHIDSQVGDPALTRYLGMDVDQIVSTDPVPTDGLLIISPIRLVGVYFYGDKFAEFRDIEPDAIIGGSMLVYDLDRLHEQGLLSPP